MIYVGLKTTGSLKIQRTILGSYNVLLKKYGITPGKAASRPFYHHLPPTNIKLIEHELTKNQSHQAALN